MTYPIMNTDKGLAPYKADIERRMQNYTEKLEQLLAPGQTLADFANGHHFFGLHQGEDGWYYREWAPGAEKMYLTGDFCGWDRHAYPMAKNEHGVFELFIPGRNSLGNGQRFRAITVHAGQELERIPLYARYVVQ